jgi:Tfp pilus assembly protein PilE
MKNKYSKGISFIEILVVVAIFAILGLLISRITLLTLRGSNKSDTIVKVRENLDYAIAIMERNLRNSDKVDPCPTTGTDRVDYIANGGGATYFSCVGTGTNTSYISSGSARLTGTDIKINTCSFSCVPQSGNTPPSVVINLEVQDTRALGIDSAKVSTSTIIQTRSY